MCVEGGGGEGEWGDSWELPVGVKEKRSRIVVLYSEEAFTERLVTSELHDSIIFFTFFNA